MLHGGQLQLAYYAALVATGWTALRLFRLREPTLAVAATVGLGAFGAVAASAWLLTPLLRDAPLLLRAPKSYDAFIAGHALSLQHLLTLLRPEALGTPINHSYVGTELWEDELYFGLIPFVCAVVALGRARHRPYARLLAVSCAATLVVAFNTPLLRAAFAVVPGFGLFRCPSRLAFLTSTLGIALGALGFESLLEDEPVQTRRLAIVGAVALMALEGAWLAHRHLKTLPAAEALPPSALAARIAGERRMTEPHRVAVVGLPAQATWPVAPARLAEVGGFDDYAFSHYRDYFELMRTGALPPPPRADTSEWAHLDRLTRRDLADALGVRWLVAPAAPDADDADDAWPTVARFDDEPWFVRYRGLQRGPLALMRNPDAAPRALLVATVEPVPDVEKMRARVAEGSIAGTSVVVMPERAESMSPAEGDGATVVDGGVGWLNVDAHAAGARFLRIGEVWHPGWRVTVDGAALPPTEIKRCDLALFGVWLPPGRHRVKVRFSPF
jgi:hypothetical protein